MSKMETTVILRSGNREVGLEKEDTVLTTNKLR